MLWVPGGDWSAGGSLHLPLQPQLCALQSTCLAFQGFVGVGREAQESGGLRAPRKGRPSPHQTCRGPICWALLAGHCLRRSTKRGLLLCWEGIE